MGYLFKKDVFMSSTSHTLKVWQKLPWILWVFVGLEVAIGASYFGVVHLASTSSLTYLLLDNLLTLVHIAMVDATIALALYDFSHKLVSRGFLLLGIFFSSLLLKDFLVALASFLASDTTDALSSSLVSVLLNTLVIDGIVFALITTLSFFIFLKEKGEPDAPKTLFEKGNPLVKATFFVTCTYTVLHLIHFIIEFVDFGHAYFWILSTGEVLTAVADFLFILAGAMLAFLSAHLCMDRFEEHK